MAQTNFTPLLLYGSSTPTNVPSAANLTNSATGSEIAINVADKNLFFKDSTNAVNTVPIRQSNTSSNGWLSSTDWNTFNGKAPAVTYTTNYIPFGQGTTTPNQSAGLQFDGTNFTTTGYAAATSFRPSSSTVPTNGLYLPAANQLGFATNTALVATMFSSGGVSIGNTTDPGAGNLQFTTSGTNGVKFGAGNLLTVYEEGTWTPSVTPQGGSLTSYSSTGSYRKIGKIVVVNATVTITNAGTSTGQLQISNFPYACLAGFFPSGNSIETAIIGGYFNCYINAGGVSGAISGVTWINTAVYNLSITYETA